MPSLKHRSLFKLHLVTTNACSIHWLLRKPYHFYGGFPQASVVYLLLSINKSFELRYLGTKDSGFCGPFPSHIINFNAGEYLLGGHVVSSYINLLTRDVTFIIFITWLCNY